MKRQKISCITHNRSRRFQVGHFAESSAPEFWAKFISELNKISVLWSDDPKVLKNVRDLLAERTDERLILLLRTLSKSGLVISNLSDADLRNVFLLN